MIAPHKSAGRRQFSVVRYKELLGETVPRPIRTERDLERVQRIVDRLTQKPEDQLPPEESDLLDLLSLLIEQYEEIHHPIPDAPPRAVLRMLMEDRGLKQKDLVPIFGNRTAVSRILTGSALITKEQARKLGEYFGSPSELFI